MAQPFIKWVGGKTQLLGEIRKRLPEDLGTTRTRYVEPFVGGGAVLYSILESHPGIEAHANDMNKELINAYATVRDEPDELIGNLASLAQAYLPLDQPARTELYLRWRERLNELIAQHANDAIADPATRVYGADSVEQASLFIAILKTCFNGLCRYNLKGFFNAHHGRYKAPGICDENRIRGCSQALANTVLHIGGYNETARLIDDRTFVYADPPYREIPGKPSFKAYQKSGFNDANQEELANFLKEAVQKGARILMSNSDPRNGDPDDSFFDDLYSWAKVERVLARRSINRNGDGRGAITEILVSFPET